MAERLRSRREGLRLHVRSKQNDLRSNIADAVRNTKVCCYLQRFGNIFQTQGLFLQLFNFLTQICQMNPRFLNVRWLLLIGDTLSDLGDLVRE